MDTKNIFAKIDQFLSGKISAEDFSYDFPVTYSLHAKYLDKTNPELSHILESELKDLCKRYDPFDYYNIAAEKCYSESEFRCQVEEIYRRCLELESEAE